MKQRLKDKNYELNMKQAFKKFVPYRRKTEGRTNYKKRLKLLVSGTPRIVVRKTNKNIIVQLVKYAENGDNVIVTANSFELKKLGWTHATGNLPAAYLTGLIAGKKSLSKDVKNAIVDLGLQTPTHGSRIYAAIKGAIDSGMTIACSEEAFPSEDRLKGKHIADFNKKSSEIVKSFEDMKNRIVKK